MPAGSDTVVIARAPGAERTEYGTALDVDVPKAVGLVGVKTAVRLCDPTLRELVDIVAVPAVVLTAGPRLAPPSWNWTVPGADGGVTVAVRLTGVPTSCGLAGVTVNTV